jgi:histidine ammonia-lyase
MKEITLDGETLDMEKLWVFCQNALNPAAKIRIHIAKPAEKRIKAAEDFLNKLAHSGKTVYGVNTGFGYFAKTRIKDKDIEELQHNIIRSHACGVGEELPRDLVLMMWLVLLNSVCRGHRGLALSRLQEIIKTLEAGILACVPARGSVGASGDLAPTAHAVLATLGEGECTMPSGKGFIKVKAADALKKAGIKPLVLGPKEGLCLINGTQLTASFGVTLWHESMQLLRTANLATAMTIEALRASHHMTDKPLLKEQRQKGTWECGISIAKWLGGETQVSKSHANCDRVQDSYSLRCAPQVHGMMWDELEQSKAVLEKEINATTDNPLLFPERELVIHGGNFHAIYPARACDRIGMALATLASISERRINTAMRTEKSGLPTFLIENGGLNSGFMMVQTTAAALVSECKSLSFPASVDSIPTNNDQEDHVSMGPGAGLKALQIMRSVRYVLAIELLVAAQGLDMLGPLKTSPQLEAVKKAIRKKVPYLDKDRHLAPDIEAVHEMVKNGELLAYV